MLIGLLKHDGGLLSKCAQVIKPTETQSLIPVEIGHTV